MFKHATLALIALLHLSSATRHPRSIWPWSASEPEEEALISEKHADILRQAGYGEYLDLSSHPLWKIHKYEGIDLKPVQVETEIIKSPRLPQLDERNPVSSVGTVTESESEAESADANEQDSGLFDQSSVLSYLLPSLGLGGEDQRQADKAGALAEAIRDEEQSHPGFFAKLWSKIWGSDESLHLPDKLGQDQTLLQIALPPTRQRYAEINLIQPTTRGTRLLIREPANQASQYAFNAGAVAQQQTEVAQPVNKWYPNLHHSQAYIQSWNPNAAYNVQVAGPSEYPSAHVATVQAYTANHFQRKLSESKPEEAQDEAASVNSHSRRDVSEGEEQPADPTTTTTESTARVPKSEKEEEQQQQQEAAPLTESQVQQVADVLESNAREQAKWENVKESIAKALSMRILPAKVASKLKGIQRQINDKKAGKESMDELRKLQAEFESRKQQLGPLYPVFRRIIPALPTQPQSSR